MVGLAFILCFDCFVCVYVWAPRAGLMLTEARRVLDPLELEFQADVSHVWVLGNLTQLLWKQQVH